MNDKGLISQCTYDEYLTEKYAYNNEGQMIECYINEGGSKSSRTYKNNKHFLTDNGEFTYEYTFDKEGYAIEILEKELVEGKHSYKYMIEYK